MWKTLPDFPNYEISPEKRIRHIKTGRYVTPIFDERSRMAVVLRRAGAQHCISVHTLARSIHSTS